MAGFTVMSISSVPYISPTEDLSKVWFTVQVALTGGLEKIVGTIRSEDVEAFTGFKTKYPLELSVSAVTERARYTIINEGVAVNRYADVVRGRVISRGIDCYTKTIDDARNAASRCDACGRYNQIDPNTADWIRDSTLIGRFGYCPYPFDYHSVHFINRQQIAIKGRIELPSIEFHADITLKFLDKTLTKRIGTRELSTNFLFDGELIATARTTGALVTGEMPPDPSAYVAVYSNRGKITPYWALAFLSEWENYATQNPVTESALTTGLGWQEAVSKNNAYVDSLLASTATIGGVPVSNATSLGNAYIDLSIPTKTLNPVVVFQIRADWLGVVVPVGKPKIISVSAPQFTSGEIGKIDVTIQNIGDGDGAFLVEVSGCEPIRQMYPSRIVPFKPMETKTISIDIVGEVSAKTTKTCTVKVTDYNMPSNFATSTVNVTILMPKICVPNEYSTRGLTLQQCLPDGTGYKDVFTCPTEAPSFDVNENPITLPITNSLIYDRMNPKNGGWMCKKTILKDAKEIYTYVTINNCVFMVSPDASFKRVVDIETGEKRTFSFVAEFVGCAETPEQAVKPICGAGKKAAWR